jgi:hypothetical protein
MSATLVQSAADSLSGSLQVGKHITSFGPVGEVAGTAPPAFHDTKKIGAFDHGYDLNPPLLLSPTLVVDTTNLVNTATSPGIGVDTLSASATAAIGSATISLTDPLVASPVLLGLSASATFIRSGSSASYVFGPNQGFLAGDASFGSLTISGSLVGFKTLTFSGDAAPNTVLFQSSTVTITLDKQTLSDFLPPVAAGAVPPVSPNRITTDALDIQLNNASVGGQLVTGDIRLGESSATNFHSPIPAALVPMA